MVNIASKTCPECGSKKLELNNDGLMCTKCGLIISESYFSGKKMLI